MPVVSSYFRRSAGSGAGPQTGRRLDVAIYSSATGSTLLRGWNRATVEDLNFSTGLPGGFLDASFTLRSPAPKLWPVDTGQKVIIRLGDRTLWWGWVEDVRRRQRGRTEEMSVTCLGPWQTLSQRKITSVAYTGTVYGNEAIASELGTYCDRISADTSQLQSTGVNIADLTKSNWPVSDLVKLVCEAGDASNRPLLFAIWEPTQRTSVFGLTNVLYNGDFEIGSPDGYLISCSAGTQAWSRDRPYDGGYSIKWTRAAIAVLATSQIDRQGYLDTVSGSTGYLLDYAVYTDATSEHKAQVTIYWGAGSTAISHWHSTLQTLPAVAGWYRFVEAVTSPATATKAWTIVYLSMSAGGEVTFDALKLYLAGTALSVDALPRAHLWPRDLTSYDYLIHTAGLPNGLDVTESTRDLANAVLASYGATPSYTAYAEDGTSQTAYRRRDYLIDAGADAGSGVAASMRDTYLAAYKDPRDEPGSFTAPRGAIRTLHGAIVEPALIRAGDRLCIADGAYAGRVVMIAGTQWSSNGLQITPEREMSMPELLTLVR